MQNTMILTLLLPLAAMPMLVVACGSPPPPKPATESTGTAASVADAGAATRSASTDDAGVAPTPVAMSAADAGTPPGELPATTTTHNDDADDACQAVAAAFEKRARPQIKACYREGKKKDPSLVGGVRIAAAVNMAGKLGNVFTSPNGDKTMLPPAVVKCMVDAVKATDPGDVTKCKGKSLAFPVQFPSQ